MAGLGRARMTTLFSGSQSLIPVSVLTGFLGSGKTTVLNHLVHSVLICVEK